MRPKTLAIVGILGAVLFAGCGGAKVFPLSEVDDEYHVSRAKDVDVPFFFDMRMKTKQESGKKEGTWEILSEDSMYVYFAAVRSEVLQGMVATRVFTQLYRVRRADMAAQLPGYAKINGYTVWSAVQEFIDKERDNTLAYAKCRGGLEQKITRELTNEGILVTYERTCGSVGAFVTYEFVLSTADLSVIRWNRSED